METEPNIFCICKRIRTNTNKYCSATVTLYKCNKKKCLSIRHTTFGNLYSGSRCHYRVTYGNFFQTCQRTFFVFVSELCCKDTTFFLITKTFLSFFLKSFCVAQRVGFEPTELLHLSLYKYFYCMLSATQPPPHFLVLYLTKTVPIYQNVRYIFNKKPPESFGEHLWRRGI